MMGVILGASTEAARSFQGNGLLTWKYSRIPVESSTTHIEASMEESSEPSNFQLFS